MGKNELMEYRNLLKERAIAERDYTHLIDRRSDLATRAVRNEDRRQRFLLRIDRDIADAHDKLVSLDMALEAFEA